MNEERNESVRRVLAFARADDERRPKTGMREAEDHPSLLDLDEHEVRQFFCHFDCNRVPEHRANNIIIHCANWMRASISYLNVMISLEHQIVRELRARTFRNGMVRIDL